MGVNEKLKIHGMDDDILRVGTGCLSMDTKDIKFTTLKSLACLL